MKGIERSLLAAICLLAGSMAFAGELSEVDKLELQYAQQLNAQVVGLYGKGEYRQAIELAQHALAIREKVLGPEHVDTATSLNNLAVLNRNTIGYIPPALVGHPAVSQHGSACVIQTKQHPRIAGGRRGAIFSPSVSCVKR